MIKGIHNVISFVNKLCTKRTFIINFRTCNDISHPVTKHIVNCVASTLCMYMEQRWCMVCVFPKLC